MNDEGRKGIFHVPVLLPSEFCTAQAGWKFVYKEYVRILKLYVGSQVK